MYLTLYVVRLLLVIKTSNNSNILSITSKESLFEDINNNDNSSQKSSIMQLSKSSSKLEDYVSKSSELLSKSNESASSNQDQMYNNDNYNEAIYDKNMIKINFLNNNLNYFNIIENINKSENDITKIRDEDRVEEL